MIIRIQFLSNWCFFKLCPSKVEAGFKKIIKLVKSGFLMIIHIYAKTSECPSLSKRQEKNL
ncbi:hypothetical protein [uncultured Gammaproteobacteria bacterium]|nr:hypothetical protein [uncultured Gammaproteobacteria bacterium]